MMAQICTEVTSLMEGLRSGLKLIILKLDHRFRWQRRDERVPCSR